MRNISFAYTTPALLAGAKTVTRRDWDPKYGESFRADQLVAAYDRSPRVHGNHVATIRLTCKPTLEPLRIMPDSDYEAEGFAWLLAHPETWPKTTGGMPAAPVFNSEFSEAGFRMWRAIGGSMWVIRFEVVSLTPEGEVQLARLATGSVS